MFITRIGLRWVNNLEQISSPMRCHGGWREHLNVGGKEEIKMKENYRSNKKIQRKTQVITAHSKFSSLALTAERIFSVGWNVRELFWPVILQSSSPPTTVASAFIFYILKLSGGKKYFYVLAGAHTILMDQSRFMLVWNQVHHNQQCILSVNGFCYSGR